MWDLGRGASPIKWDQEESLIKLADNLVYTTYMGMNTLHYALTMRCIYAPTGNSSLENIGSSDREYSAAQDLISNKTSDFGEIQG